MEIPEYERRRNEHVLLRAEELRKLLEASSSSHTSVNDAILGQARSAVCNVGGGVISSTGLSGKRVTKPAVSPVRHSQRLVGAGRINYKEDTRVQEEQERRSVPQVHQVMFNPD
jgi:hypothetical protein